MDDKTMETLFYQIKTEETPDLWARIEKSLPEQANHGKASAGQADGAAHVEDRRWRKRKKNDEGYGYGMANDGKNKKKVSRRRYIGIGLAAAACIMIFSVPLGLLLTTAAKNETSAGTTYDMVSNNATATEAKQDAGYGGGEYDAVAAAADGATENFDDVDLMAEEGVASQNMEMASGETAANNQDEAGQSGEMSAERKLIKTVNMDIETLDFDGMVKGLKETVSGYGGYFEVSDINGSSVYREHLKFGNFTVRIPAQHLAAFIEKAGSLGNVLYTSENTEDITLRYVDTQSRIEALRVQQEKLMELMEKAENMEDVLKIENELTNIRYELEYYESMKKQYDNKVDYSTVEMSIKEVREETPTEEIGIGQRMKEGFLDTLENISDSGQAVMVWFVASIPYFIILAVIVVVVVIIIMKIRRRRRKNM